MDDNGLKTISREARDEYIRLALAVTKTARELKKPLSELGVDELGVHLEEMREAAPFIDSLPKILGKLYISTSLLAVPTSE